MLINQQQRDALKRLGIGTIAGLGAYAANQLKEMTPRDYYNLYRSTPWLQRQAQRKSLRDKRLKGYRKPKKKTLKAKVKSIQKHLSQEIAMHTHRNRECLNALVGDGLAAYSIYDNGGKIADIESSVAALRFYDTSTNALVVNNISTGTYNREITLSISRKITVRNNYQVPVQVRIYNCTPKRDTNIDPKSGFTQGLTDQMVTPALTSPLTYPTDSDEFNHQWTSKVAVNKMLQPGEQCTATHFTKDFSFDFSDVDNHALVYQRSYGGHAFLLRLVGALGHDSVAGEYGNVTAGVDVEDLATYKIKYDAGQNLNDFTVSDNGATSFTNTPVVSNKPVSDNQSFSVS